MRATRGLILAMAAGAAYGQQSRPVEVFARGFSSQVGDAVPRLRELMREGLDRKEPYDLWWRSMGGGALVRTSFRGSYDRHSNMAAHWALLVLARIAGDLDAVNELAGRFTTEALRDEAAFIEATHRRSPVRPYDRTWLVLLLKELEPSLDDARLAAARDLRILCERGLLDMAEEESTSSRPSFEPASRATTRATSRRVPPRPAWLSGAYASQTWAMAVLELAGTADPASAARLAALRETKLAEVRRRFGETRPENRFTFDAGYDFFDAPTIAELAFRAGAPENNPGFEAAPFVPLPERITMNNCHKLGVEISKTWADAFAAGRGDAAARKAVDERLTLYMTRRDAWDGPFASVSHWTPQFLFFSLWLAAGRP